MGEDQLPISQLNRVKRRTNDSLKQKNTLDQLPALLPRSKRPLKLKFPTHGNHHLVDTSDGGIVGINLFVRSTGSRPQSLLDTRQVLPSVRSSSGDPFWGGHLDPRAGQSAHARYASLPFLGRERKYLCDLELKGSIEIWASRFELK